MDKSHRSKTLQELEGQDWGETELQSRLVMNAHRLHRVPLCKFTVEDLRFMISQQQGLTFLVPIALEHLHADPLVEGDYYAGDLLAAILLADSKFWIASPELHVEATQITRRAFALLAALDEEDRQTTQEAIARAHNIFQRADYFAQHGRA